MSMLIATYTYCDENGKTLFQVLRYDPKGFKQRRPDTSPHGKGGWVYSLDGVRRVLYRLPEVLAAVAASRAVYVCEGEKDTDNLVKLGLAATTNPGGAGKDKWLPGYTEALTGAHVVIVPDNDAPGREHAQAIASALAAEAADVRIVKLPDLPDKGDVSDWLAAGGTGAELERLAAEAPTWTPPEAASSRPWPSPLGEAAYHGLAGEIVRTIAPHSEADDAALLLQLLDGVGNLIGRGPHYRVEGDDHFTNLFVLVLGRTAKARKGTSWGRIRSLVERVDPDWAKYRVMSGLSTGEGLIEKVKDHAAEDAAPVDPAAGEWLTTFLQLGSATEAELKVAAKDADIPWKHVKDAKWALFIGSEAPPKDSPDKHLRWTLRPHCWACGGMLDCLAGEKCHKCHHIRCSNCGACGTKTRPCNPPKDTGGL